MAHPDQPDELETGLSQDPVVGPSKPRLLGILVPD
jgi:hypothetical protein